MSTFDSFPTYRGVKRTFRYLTGFAVMILILGSCAKEDLVQTDLELEPYFQIFADEALKRGILVDYDAERIEGLLDDIPDTYIQGQCFHNEKKPKKVVIDITYWDNADESEKEFIIAHELGHCFLLRPHLDTSHPDGTCVSIMHSSPSVCIFQLTDQNRTDYYNELFSY